MRKKLIAILFGLALALSLTGCGDETSENKATENNTNESNGTEAAATEIPEDNEAAVVYPEKKVLIGVEIYDPTESETLAIQEYFSKLAETYNIEFKYSEAITDADGEMKFIEDCAIAGCQGFIGIYNVTGLEQIQKVIDFGIYYYGYDNDEAYDEFQEEPYYLGVITTGGDEYDAGKAMGGWVTEKGYTNVVFANGGADFGVEHFVDRQNGFTEAVSSDVNVITVSGFPGDQFFADQESSLSIDGLEAVVTSFNGVDFWAQPIASAGLTKQVELATIGAVNETYLNAFGSGACALLVANNLHAHGFGVALICNAVDGNSDALREEGQALRLASDFWIVDNVDDCKKLYEVMSGDGVFTAEQLMTLSVKLNPAASAKTVKELLATGSMEAVLGR